MYLAFLEGLGIGSAITSGVITGLPGVIGVLIVLEGATGSAASSTGIRFLAYKIIAMPISQLIA